MTLKKEGYAVCGVEVTPTNLELMTEREAQAVHQTYRNLLDQIEFPIQVYSIQDQLDLETYTDYVKDHGTHQELGEDYLSYCQQFNRDSLATTSHYILTRTEPSTKSVLSDYLDLDYETEDLRSEAERRIRQVLESLNTSELTADLIKKNELEDLADRFTGEPGYRYLKNDNGYQRFLTVTEYPSNLELGWPLELLRVSGKVDMTQLIQPRDTGKTRKTLNRTKEKLNGELTSRITGGFVDTNKLETQFNATEWMLDTLVDREQQPFDYTNLIAVHGETQEDCDSTYQRVQSRLKMMGIKAEEPVFRTDQAQKTLISRQGNPLDEHNLLLSNSVAAGFPFGTRTVDQDSGVIYGEDQFDSTPILQNRFNWNAPHLARFGFTGSGKSYHTKLELLRVGLTQGKTRIIVIDPKNEYQDVIKAFGGTVHNVTDRPEKLDHTNCFQVPERGQTESIEEIIELIEYLYESTSRNEGNTLVVIDEAHNITNVEEGRRILTRWVREARDTSTAITVVSQSASDFTQYPEGQTLLDQCPAKVFFRHQRVSDSMIDYFQLSEQEVIDLHNLKTGTDSQYSEAVLKISGRIDTKLQINATPAEHTLIEQ